MTGGEITAPARRQEMSGGGLVTCCKKKPYRTLMGAHRRPLDHPAVVDGAQARLHQSWTTPQPALPGI